MKAQFLLIGLIALIVLLAGCTQPYQAPPAGNNPPPADNNPPQAGSSAVEISGFAFSPSTITIKAGDTVTWTNLDSVKHTVTSDSGTELSSELFGQNETYSHTFNTAGTFDYHCIPHPSMKGKVIVT